MSDTSTTTGTTDGKRQFDAAMLSKCRALLAEESAVLVSLERGTWRKKVPPPENSPADTPPTYTDAAWVRIVRRWPRISDGDRAMCEEFLARFASVKNATVTPPATEPAECGTVEEPKTDRETFSGTWRMRKTALSALRTDPMQQGVYQTLVWPAEFNGEVGAYCAESSALHHEDATIYTNAAEPPDAEHQDTPGVIVRVNGSIDPDTGLWSGQRVVDTTRDSGLYGTWSVRADSVTLRVRGEHREAPLFPLLSGTTVAAIKALADDFVNATASTDEQKAAALAAAVALCDHPAMTSTADMDQYALFSVSAEITFPVASLVATVRRQKRQVELVANYSNYAAEPTWAQAVAALPTADATFVGALDLLDYALEDGGAPRKNEFGLLDGTVTWRIPVQDSTAGNGGGLVGTWGKSAERITIRIRGDYQESPIFPTLTTLTDSAIETIAADFAQDWDGTETESSKKQALSTKLSALGVETACVPSVTTTADMDPYGLFSVTAEISWSVKRVRVSLHGHRRWVDVEVAFHGCAAIPTWDSVHTGTGATATNSLIANEANVNSGDVVSEKHITASLSVREDEFTTLAGEVVYRVPLKEFKDWKKIVDATDEEVWRCWGWNQAESGETNSPFSSGELNKTKTDTSNVLYTHRIDVDFNEFGLVDYVVTATGEKAPYNAGSLGSAFKSGKEPDRYRFVHNHTPSALNSSEGYIELVHTTHWTKLGCFSSLDSAQTAASAAVNEQDGGEGVTTSIGRHGRWYTLAVSITNHSTTHA